MSKQLSRIGIEKRIRRALECLQQGDPEDAIFHIAPALDATAKKRYPDRKVGKRIKEFIFNEQPLIYYLSMQGTELIPDGIRIVIVDNDNVENPIGGHGGELADFIYHNIRCAQAHGEEIDYELIDFGRNFGIGRSSFDNDGGDLEPGRFIVSSATILALILSVICAPENKRLKLPGDISLYNRLTLSRSELPGNKSYLMAELGKLFTKTTNHPPRSIQHT